MKTNFSVSLLTPRLGIGAKVRSQMKTPQCLVTVLGLGHGAAWGSEVLPCPPQADPAPAGQREMAAGERAGKDWFCLVF